MSTELGKKLTNYPKHLVDVSEVYRVVIQRSTIFERCEAIRNDRVALLLHVQHLASLHLESGECGDDSAALGEAMRRAIKEVMDQTEIEHYDHQGNELVRLRMNARDAEARLESEEGLTARLSEEVGELTVKIDQLTAPESVALDRVAVATVTHEQVDQQLIDSLSDDGEREVY